MSQGILEISGQVWQSDFEGDLAQASVANDIPRLQALFQDPDVKIDQDMLKAAGQCAAGNRSVEAIKLLLANGMTPNWAPTAISAANQGCMAILQELENYEWDIHEEGGFEAATVSLASGHRHVLDWLLARGVPSSHPKMVETAAGFANPSTFDYLLHHNNWSLEDTHATALHVAARASAMDPDGRCAMMEHLLALGADINALDSDLMSKQPAHIRGFEMESEHQPIHGSIGTPLSHAAHVGSVEGIRWLMTHGADPNTKSCWGQAPMDYAKRYGSDKIISVLREMAST